MEQSNNSTNLCYVHLVIRPANYPGRVEGTSVIPTKVSKGFGINHLIIVIIIIIIALIAERLNL